MDVYEDENDVKILHVDVELQSLFGSSSNALLTNIKTSSSEVPSSAPVRKQRLLFTGAPPDAISNSTPDFDKRLLLLTNIHWALTDVDIIDGSCTYGPVAGVYIFENPQKFNKSDGIAIIEFRSASSAESAMRDEGKCWTSKQGDRRVAIQPVPTEAVRMLMDLSDRYGCWTKAAQLPNALFEIIYGKLGKAVPTEQAATTVIAQSAPKPQTNKLPVPIAVQVLLDKLDSAS